jgi:nitrous oxidase accessory protein
MMGVRTLVRLGLAAAFAANLSSLAHAERIAVPVGTSPQKVVDLAAEGDVVVLKAGEHRGPIRITRKLTVEGERGAV